MPRRKPELTVSEFTFAYNFLHEHHTMFQGNLIAAPILPSLFGESELGFDACLPTSAACFFFQFKRSYFITRQHPRRRNRQPPPYAAPFYRIYLHRKGDYNQHFLLKGWSGLFRTTYYVAPQINDNATYYQAARAGVSWMCSRSIPVNQLNEQFTRTDNEQHFIEFKESVDDPLICSDFPIPIKKSIKGNNLKEVYLRQRKWPIDNLTRYLAEKTYSFITEHWADKTTNQIEKVSISDNPQKQEIIKSLLYSSNLLSAYLGIVPVLVGER